MVDLRLGYADWRAEVREFLHTELPPGKEFYLDYDEDDERWKFAVEFSKKVADRGWIGLTWPRQYGGLERSVSEQYILTEEFHLAEAPLINLIGWSLAAGILLYGGTDAQKSAMLPDIAGMRTIWAEGLTEPGAGSDLAALTTTAARSPDGTHWLMRGQKTYTTFGARSDVLLTIARTDPDRPRRHEGLSIFAVDLRAPGVTIQPLWNIAGGRQNHIFLDDVAVPDSHLIGEVNCGWEYITRSFYAGGVPFLRHSTMERKYRMLLDYCKRASRGGQLLIDQPGNRDRLAEMSVMIEAQRVLAETALSDSVHGRRSDAGAMYQVLAKECIPRFAQLACEVAGPLAQLSQQSPYAVLAGEIQAWYLQSFGNHAAGTPQIKRMVLATRSLGLPR
jgi:alkylation response protein AidB-like acyl-CoA dehydrogenase